MKFIENQTCIVSDSFTVCARSTVGLFEAVQIFLTSFLVYQTELPPQKINSYTLIDFIGCCDRFSNVNGIHGIYYEML